MDGTYWIRVRWYIIPEETAAGRQSHNLRRELYRTNDFADVEVIMCSKDILCIVLFFSDGNFILSATMTNSMLVHPAEKHD